jgi:hypothetical protein
MLKPLLDPGVAYTALSDPALTRCDEEHLVSYLGMLDKAGYFEFCQIRLPAKPPDIAHRVLPKLAPHRPQCRSTHEGPPEDRSGPLGV